MRFLFVIIPFSIFFGSCESLAQSPPFSLITLTGQTSTTYNRVSLFESGSATEPVKTEFVSDFDGQYSIDVNIPEDMRQKDSYYFTDMRFWADTNENGVKDSDERISECHFIIWVPSLEKIFLQIYKGAKYPIDSSLYYYNYNN